MGVSGYGSLPTRPVRVDRHHVYSSVYSSPSAQTEAGPRFSGQTARRSSGWLKALGFVGAALALSAQLGCSAGVRPRVDRDMFVPRSPAIWKTLQDYGAPSPDYPSLKANQNNVRRILENFRIRPDKNQEISLDDGARIYYETDTFSQLPPHQQWLIHHEIDRDDNNRLSLFEMALFDYRRDQWGDRDGEGDAWEEIRMGKGLSGKAYLMDEAKSVGLTPAALAQLQNILASNEFGVADLFWFESLDLPRNNTDEMVGAHKGKTLAERYDEALKKVAPEYRAQAKRKILEILIEKRMLPFLVTAENGDLYLLTFDVARKSGGDVPPGVVEYEIEPLNIMYNLRTGKGNEYHSPVQTFRMMDPAVYRESMQSPLMTQKLRELEQAFRSPRGKKILRHFYDNQVANLANKRGMEQLFQPLFDIVQDVYGTRVTFSVFDDGNAGAYSHPKKRFTIATAYLAEMVIQARRDKVPEAYIKEKIFEVLAGTLVHELWHALQHQLADAYRADPEKFKGSPDEARIRDYVLNADNYLYIAKSPALTGDKNAYANQPIEKDAYVLAERFLKTAYDILGVKRADATTEKTAGNGLM